MDMRDTYTHLITWLDQQGVTYRLIDHAPEGRTDIVSALRSNTLSQAAKCIVLMVKIGKKSTQYVLPSSQAIPGWTCKPSRRCYGEPTLRLPHRTSLNGWGGV